MRQALLLLFLLLLLPARAGTTGAAIAAEYPDPTRDTGGSLCDGEPPFPPELFGRISASDSLYASSFVLPTLNHHLCEAARRHGWLWVPSPSLDGHGWCAEDQRWINTTIDSTALQASHRGAMHPNASGHAAMGAKIADVLGQMVAGSPPAPPISCPAAPSLPGP